MYGDCFSLSFLLFLFSSPPPPRQDARLHSCNLQRAFKGATTCPICDEPRLPRATLVLRARSSLLAHASAFVVISEARRRTLLRAGRELVNEQLSVPIAPTLLRRDELATIIQFRVAPSSRRRISSRADKEREAPFAGKRPLFRLPKEARERERERFLSFQEETGRTIGICIDSQVPRKLLPIAVTRIRDKRGRWEGAGWVRRPQ